LNQSTFLKFDPIAITANERLIAPQSVGISSELKNSVFQHAAGGTWMFRHFRWLQAIENGRHSKITLPDRTSQMPRQNRRERFWTTPWALARRAEGRMPESTAGMRGSGVRMVMLKKPWMAFSTEN
jgi:hypothetical protein